MRAASKRGIRRFLVAAGVMLLAALGTALFIVPAEVEKRMNRTRASPSPAVSEPARRLHARLLIADLHADTLLWDRPLLQRSSRGHVDVPRLLEGNVAIQAFTVVTKVPRGLNIERNDASTDLIRLQAVAQRWPPATWRSLKHRALHQASRLHEAAGASGGQLVVLRSAANLESYLERRRNHPQITAGLLGIEGAHALDGDLNNLKALFDAGFRMMAPTHFFDNDLGGSAHGVDKGGLTEKGRAMIREMEARGMILDLAHASPRLLDDALAQVTRPVVVSHTGVQGTCDNRRNLSDRHVRAIARTGGVIGIGYWRTAVCGDDARAIARAIRHVANLAGVAHVALGSDFDGAVTTPFDTGGIAHITDALLAEGFSEAEIRLIMGENVVRVLRNALPPQ